MAPAGRNTGQDDGPPPAATGNTDQPAARTGDAARVAALEADNERLRAELGQRAGRPANPEPRFELSAGEQQELQTQGFTRAVRDSRVIVYSDFPDLVDVDHMTDEAKIAGDRAKADRDKRPAAGRK